MVEKIVSLIKSIDDYVQKAEQDDLTDTVPEFPGLEEVPELVELFEKTIAKLLRRQRKLYLDALKDFIAKDDSETLAAYLVYIQQNLFAVDEFEEQFGEAAAEFLQTTIEKLVEKMMESIDRDVAFEVLSVRAMTWIEEWSRDLARIMQLSTHTAVEKLLTTAIEEGQSIADVEMAMKDLPAFNRNRAGTTAITEVLTASSHAQHESYAQSPAVTGKKWKHSGGKKNNPRENHVALDGTVVGVDELFTIPGSMEICAYPRDPSLPASERVHCHCALGPVVDEEILGLSAEEKRRIRDEALASLVA
ncbi:phage minor head protein [Terribacillus saccharophilus]|uniref:phage minor head protein n=1 Tax=Terribacillus saccharophilus TaxID=361277 RepID=UPI003D27D328